MALNLNVQREIFDERRGYPDNGAVDPNVYPIPRRYPATSTMQRAELRTSEISFVWSPGGVNIYLRRWCCSKRAKQSPIEVIGSGLTTIVLSMQSPVDAMVEDLSEP